MIVLYHKDGKPTEAFDQRTETSIPIKSKNLTATLFELAENFPDRFIIWCDEDVRADLNRKELERLFINKKIMVSFAPTGNWMPESIGYVEDSAFLNINKKVRFPTWLMSGIVGGTHASIMLLARNSGIADSDLKYFLNSVAKLAMPLGLYCYSEPKLLNQRNFSQSAQANTITLFRFVKQHYKTSWCFLLALNMIVYERKFPIISLIAAMFFRRRKLGAKSFQEIIIPKRQLKRHDVDVLIPTIGRKEYLHDVLRDLSLQTLLPKRVIIVEQNPQPESISELDYLKNDWPFEIVHEFTHQAGACNARNVALNHIKNDWIFFADDDIRIAPNFLELAFQTISESNADVYHFSCVQKGNKPKQVPAHQTSIFGAGSSIVSKESIDNLFFDPAFEHGFGEDSDFGNRLINKGFDVTYLSHPSIVHLKAPVGGFRQKPKMPWESNKVSPRPSPQVLLWKKRHFTKQQFNGYKLVSFVKWMGIRNVFNPIAYYKKFQAQWRSSVHWANKLDEKC